ncbi:MAG: FGGY family carbohydrate kinase, partial [Actinomycetales bacterium]
MNTLAAPNDPRGHQPALLAIDAGSTVTKSVIFSTDGHILATASRRVRHHLPAPHHVERDIDEVWASVVETVRECLASLESPSADENTRPMNHGPIQIAAIGVTSHGDGIYLVDADGRPTRAGIMSLDTRARDIATQWEQDGTAATAQQLTGQRPWASAPSALLAWLVRHEPDILEHSAYALACKDVLRHRLTGVFATERTEASTSFTNVATQVYDEAVLDLYGLAGLGRLLPPILECHEVGGRLTEQTASELGLP